MTEQSKRGRPPKSVEDRKRNNLTMRMRDATKEKLEREARANGRSLSEEAEARIEQSFHSDALRIEAANLAHAFGLRPFRQEHTEALASGGFLLVADDPELEFRIVDDAH